MTKAAPERTDFGYLRGWFLPEAKGNHRVAADMARSFLTKPLPSATKTSNLDNPNEEPDMAMIDVQTAPMKDLVNLFNELKPADAKPVKRFASRKSAIDRLRPLMDHTARRAVGIARSWNDPKVKAKRSTRHRVRVSNGKGDPTEYRSVKQAFDELGLPIKEHIHFRMQLKEAGQLEEYGFTWTLVEA